MPKLSAPGAQSHGLAVQLARHDPVNREAGLRAPVGVEVDDRQVAGLTVAHLGPSGRAMRDALVAGTTEPLVLADVAKGKLRKKIPALREALEGRFEAHHALIIGAIPAHLDFLDEQAAALSEAIEPSWAPIDLHGSHRLSGQHRVRSSSGMSPRIGVMTARPGGGERPGAARATGCSLLVGRELERARLDALLAAARAGRSGVLVVRGEAGVGKTALLDDAAGRAAGMRVLRARGVEAESGLAFAALDELLRPVLSYLDGLPERQAAALRGALALSEASEVDRFAAYVATLGLLAATAEEGPLLALVDDAHWLDGSSAEALVFAGRRLEAEGIALVFAAREGDPDGFQAPGIEELRVDQTLLPQGV